MYLLDVMKCLKLSSSSPALLCSKAPNSTLKDSIQKKRSRADIIIQMHPTPPTHNFLKLVEGWFSLSVSSQKFSNIFFKNFSNILSKLFEILINI